MDMQKFQLSLALFDRDDDWRKEIERVIKQINNLGANIEAEVSVYVKLQDKVSLEDASDTLFNAVGRLLDLTARFSTLLNFDLGAAAENRIYTILNDNPKLLLEYQISSRFQAALGHTVSYKEFANQSPVDVTKPQV